MVLIILTLEGFMKKLSMALCLVVLSLSISASASEKPLSVCGTKTIASFNQSAFTDEQKAIVSEIEVLEKKADKYKNGPNITFGNICVDIAGLYIELATSF